MTTLGDVCTSRSNPTGIGGGYTIIGQKYSSSEGGHITSWCIYNMSGVTYHGKLKVFRSDGTNWIFVGESGVQDLVPGLNSGLTADIYFDSGDYLIGLYTTDGFQPSLDSGTGYVLKSKSGDITTTTAQSSWNTFGTFAAWSLQVTYTPSVSEVYVNSSSGNDSNVGDSCVAGHPVQTFGKAYSLLASGGTIHVCNNGADFSGETVTFTKGFSITVDGDGNFYMPVLS